MYADKLVVSTSCSLLHTAVDLVNETKLDNEIKSWLAFAAQKVVEVNALAKALSDQKDEVINPSFLYPISEKTICFIPVCFTIFMVSFAGLLLF